MSLSLEPRLTQHLERHARRLHRLACGFGRAGDADDILQTLYTRWWRRMRDEPGWEPPETHVELFVCVRRVAIDLSTREQRARSHEDADPHSPFAASPEDSLQAEGRLRWILSRMPPQLVEVLEASLCAGRRQDAIVARELGITAATFTQRLFKARRAAEELASLYEHLSLDDADLVASFRFGRKTLAALASEHRVSREVIEARIRDASFALEARRRAS